MVQTNPAFLHFPFFGFHVDHSVFLILSSNACGLEMGLGVQLARHYSGFEDLPALMIHSQGVRIVK